MADENPAKAPQEQADTSISVPIGPRGAPPVVSRKLPAWIPVVSVSLAAFLALALGALLVLRLAPGWLADTQGLKPGQRVEEIRSVRTALLALLAGSIAVVGAVYTARSYGLNRASHELDQQRLVTDRFTRAIEQLGGAPDVRLGAIYALERIARDSREDRPAIAEVLAAYVREHAPWADESGEIDRQRAPTDIQAVITVLARNPFQDFPGQRLDLVYVDLRLISIGSGNALDDAQLQGSHLEGAYLNSVSLRGANFTGAHLDHAEFGFSKFSREDEHDESIRQLGFRYNELNEPPHASFKRAHLDRAKLYWADLRSVDLSNATLELANLDNARLNSANLRGSKASRASLNGADLSRAWLTSADLSDADLSEADLSTADLRNANLRNANLSEANLTKADLRGTQMVGASVDDADLTGAEYDHETVWPTGDIPSGWGEEVVSWTLLDEVPWWRQGTETKVLRPAE